MIRINHPSGTTTSVLIMSKSVSGTPTGSTLINPLNEGYLCNSSNYGTSTLTGRFAANTIAEFASKIANDAVQTPRDFGQVIDEGFWNLV